MSTPPAERHGLIRTYHRRDGRVSARHEDTLDRLWPVYGVAVPHTEVPPLDPAALYGRTAPLVLEIGSGMGDATADLAAADPDRDYLAVEVHRPGVANLLALVEQRRLTNVRVAYGDAVDLLRHAIRPESLAAIHVFFPDPWPKARHHKRRLIQPSHVALLRSRLVRGGTLHCATDWAPYAEAMLRTLTADPGLVNTVDGFAARPPHRPRTKFEERGTDAGRDVYDLLFRVIDKPGADRRMRR